MSDYLHPAFVAPQQAHFYFLYWAEEEGVGRHTPGGADG
jgi:hypothetical protein